MPLPTVPPEKICPESTGQIGSGKLPQPSFSLNCQGGKIKFVILIFQYKALPDKSII